MGWEAGAREETLQGGCAACASTRRLTIQRLAGGILRGLGGLATILEVFFKSDRPNFATFRHGSGASGQAVVICVGVLMRGQKISVVFQGPILDL